MRKRAQLKGKYSIDEPKHIIEKSIKSNRDERVRFKKNMWIPIILLSIFFLVLLLNTYFNFSSGISLNPEGEGLYKYYLSGPDPYYNMRLVDVTVETGQYPFYTEVDPLLNYPIGESGGRAPLFNMMAIGFSRFLTPFMDELDAVGYSMQFVPALFGALLVFPIYFIGKSLFNKKAGLIAALFIALIPIHLGSGHGSSYSLFDHDSFNLLMYFLTFLFLIYSIKTKDRFKSILYAILAGVPLAALTMTWVEAQFLYAVIAVYAIIQMVIDIFTNKIESRVAISATLVLLVGYFVSLPIKLARGGFKTDNPFYLLVIVAIFGFAYYIFAKKKIPWTISLPVIFGGGAIGLVFLYFVRDLSASISALSPLTKISNIIYGTGIYGNKVAMTIAEANTSNISTTVMSFGPALYWIGWAGFAYLALKYYKNHQRRDYLFIIVLFLINLWLTGTAGRFLNDMVPVIAILAGWMIWIVVVKIDYKQMVRNIRSAGGGIHGIRRGIKGLHIFGILFIAVLVILPNAYLAFDAAIPRTLKEDSFGDMTSGAFGINHGKEGYWINAFDWLNDQDLEIDNPVDRPAFISWWDYGFYEVAVGDHPTVADNFQDGIPPASNFHTSTSEEEAVSIWIVRLLEGDFNDNEGKISQKTKNALNKHLDVNDTNNITAWVENPRLSPSYGTPIGEEYDEELSQEWRVGDQYIMNAAYHDITELLMDRLDDEGITWLYHDIQESTGYSIRYYGVEGYDKQIFNIFAFLSDKSLLLVAGGGLYNPEDDYIERRFVTQNGNEFTYEELNNLSDEALREDPPININDYYKDEYFETMFYKTYIGPSTGESGSKSEFNYQLPCLNMKHYYAEFISDLTKYQYYSGKSAVVIAKYYEGAYVNGTVYFDGEPLDAHIVATKNLTYYENFTIPVDHDSTNTDINGSFNLISGAGGFLQIRRNDAPGSGGFLLKNITFSGSDEYSTITDNDAMRQPGSNFERILNISIEPASLDGYAYIDLDDVEGYNVSTDEPLENVEIVIWEVTEIDPETGQASQFGEVIQLTTDENGYYNTSGLLPGFYVMQTQLEGYALRDALLSLNEGKNSHNISKPKLSNVEVIIYLDSNEDGEYTTGEEVDNANVELLYDNPYTSIDFLPVNSSVTTSNGRFEFKSLIPGPYVINASKLNDITGYNDYATSLEIEIAENETSEFNVSLDLATISVSGYTRDGSNEIGNINLVFSPDETVENNDAIEGIASSDEISGEYQVSLKPGSYNVSASQMDGLVTVYSYDGKLTLTMGQGIEILNIPLTKESVTISGTTTYNTIPVDNVTIRFDIDENVENNSAIETSVLSNEDGFYTMEIKPGSYLVVVENTVPSENITYTYTDSLVVFETQTQITYNIPLSAIVE